MGAWIHPFAEFIPQNSHVYKFRSLNPEFTPYQHISHPPITQFTHLNSQFTPGFKIHIKAEWKAACVDSSSVYENSLLSKDKRTQTSTNNKIATNTFADPPWPWLEPEINHDFRARSTTSTWTSNLYIQRYPKRFKKQQLNLLSSFSRWSRSASAIVDQ